MSANRCSRFWRDDEAQAMMEWALMILPVVMFLFIPIELGMKQRAAITELCALNYGACEKAWNQTSDGTVKGDMEKIIKTNIKTLNPKVSGTSLSTDSSTGIFGGSFSSIYGIVWDVIAWSTFMDKDNLRKSTTTVEFKSDLGNRLAGLYKATMRKSMEDADTLINFKRQKSDQMTGDPWLAKWTDGGKYDRKTAESNVLDQWGIPGIAVLDTLKTVYKDVLTVLDDIYQAAEDVVNAVYDFGDPYFLNSKYAYGLPWGRIELDKVVEPE